MRQLNHEGYMHAECKIARLLRNGKMVKQITQFYMYFTVIDFKQILLNIKILFGAC